MTSAFQFFIYIFFLSELLCSSPTSFRAGYQISSTILSRRGIKHNTSLHFQGREAVNLEEISHSAPFQDCINITYSFTAFSPPLPIAEMCVMDRARMSEGGGGRTFFLTPLNKPSANAIHKGVIPCPLSDLPEDDMQKKYSTMFAEPAE